MAAIQEDQVDLVLHGKPLDMEGTNEVDVLVRVQPLSQGSRTPTHVVCVVDVSGSMNTIAKVQDDSGNTAESDGLTYLDVVKHATRTIIHTLGADDLFSLVSYSSQATVVLEAISMTDNGRKEATKATNNLRAQGQTNIWDGLHSGMELVRRNFENNPNHNGSVMLLTDGRPNVRPPRGEQTMLERYKDEHPNIRFTVNTFGFGYNLDSPLLIDLSAIGNGTYAFIPDSGFVGTVFVNSLSNTLSTMATNTVIALEPVNGASISKIHGGYPSTTTSWGAEVHLGSCNYGQSRDVVITLQVPNTDDKYLEATLTYVTTGSTDASRKTEDLAGISNGDEVDIQKFRCRFADTVRAAQAKCLTGLTNVKAAGLPEATNDIEAFVDEIANSTVAGEERVEGILKDLTGQVTEAFSKKDFFEKWGRHYLPSLINAHMMQLCNNFKDPGVQFYGGELFKSVQTLADNIFLGLPPPVPSKPQQAQQRGGGNGRKQKAAAPVRMDRYMNRYGGCFDGYGWVQYADGSEQMVCNVKKGDRVLTSNNEFADVVCVIKTEIEDTYDLVKLPSGLNLTPFHPIRVNGEWKFPIDVAPCTLQKCDAVYNFVLSNGHVMVINGEEACTLGHGFTDNKVITHPYFGTQAIIEDLKGLQGWSRGLVVFQDNWLRLDSQTNLLSGLKPSHEIVVMN